MIKLKNIAKEKLNEFSFTNQSMKMVKNDIKKFVLDEHKKLNNTNVKDTLDMIRQLLVQMTSKDIK